MRNYSYKTLDIAELYVNFNDAEKQQFVGLIQNNVFPEVYIENEEMRLLYNWYMR